MISPGNLSYHLADPSHFSAIHQLYMDDVSNRFLTFDLMEKTEFLPIFEDIVKDQNLFVAKMNNEIIGSFRLISKTHRQAHIIYLAGFVIRNDYTNQGFGRKMLDHIIEVCNHRQVRRLELTVDINNIIAITLYKKAGFTIDGTIKISYRVNSSGEYYDEYLMSLLL